jgi:hypothetical protein
MRLPAFPACCGQSIPGELPVFILDEVFNPTRAGYFPVSAAALVDDQVFREELRGSSCVNLYALRSQEANMTREKPLKPDDFPVEREDNSIVTHKDEPVATAPSLEKAEDIARRLNEQAAREEEDRWSA